MYENLIRASQEKDYVSDTKINQLMLFRKTIENLTKQTSTIYGQSADF
jgi:hypothetical protein